MNYLAHIYLAENNDESMLGNFLGDFVKKSTENNYEYAIRKGIFMHRKLDTFTDSHPIFIKSKRRISSLNSRFAGILIDMFYDHFLAKNWSYYSPVPLEQYAGDFYDILKNFSNTFPDKLIRMMPVMISENWLFSYKEIETIERALDRISMRFSRSKHSLSKPINELTNNYESLEADFKVFYEDAIKYANELKSIS